MDIIEKYPKSNGDLSVPTIEVTTHEILRDLLRRQPEIPDWNHYLTMARLVARALRMSKSALIQTGIATHRVEGKYRLSYVLPALLWNEAVTIVMPVQLQTRFLATELPRFQQWLGTHKPVYCDALPPPPGFKGVWVTDPQSWLRLQLDRDKRLLDLPTIIDSADDLENWAQQLLTVRLTPEDWNDLRASQSFACWEKTIEIQGKLLESFWQRPIDPYDCYVLDPQERSLVELLRSLVDNDLHPHWQAFYQQLAVPSDRLIWASLDRSRGKFTLSITPTDIVTYLAPIWQRQPTVLITSAVDLTNEALGYRQELGLGEITSVKFTLDRQADLLQLYIPRWMPMPNTSKFQPVLMDEIQHLLHLIDDRKFTVILIQDTPLQAQIAAILAAEWGSKVQVERADLDRGNILVCGWEFWQLHQDVLPAPQLTIVATLPIPSLEDPLVAAKVSYYKRQKQDWFRLYLLPTGLRILHRALDPMRMDRGIVAIFDNRIDRRSYGKQVLTALSPFARIDYLDLSAIDRRSSY